ncbi:MAG: protocatechuate 3,4-dioxygenase subunit alpha [Actinomycetota bacterium]|nr:protocatechuate 3,4-dioxygenase subunit alpha [Actinomycetota bacterium]
MTDLLGPTPSQTVGPYLSLVLPWADGSDVVAPGTAAMITIVGQLIDGTGNPVPDGLVEVWQADPEGRFNHADDPRGAVVYERFRGFGRCPTDERGRFVFHTLKPGALPDGAGGSEAPHINVSTFARGLLNRVVTRMYFPDEPANDSDPVLSTLTSDERRLLTAVVQADATLRFDICLQGDHETPFFEI